MALRTARVLLGLGHSREVVLNNPIIPAEQREFVEEQLRREDNITLTPARALVSDPHRFDWVGKLDRSKWYYWPTLRDYLTAVKGWDGAIVRSIDDSSDRVLQQLAPPWDTQFNIRGLVLGHVQSGKTANFTALIAKAADAGYRLVIVLSGIDNGLRLQTQMRLKKELVGFADNRATAVRFPPAGSQWHEFTHPDLNGDFFPGFANQAALQGASPVLLVVKKNGAVLRRLQRWLESSPQSTRKLLPVLVIDDEADLASVDTRGTYQTDDDAPDPEYEEPSVINGLLRNLLQTFPKCSYVAYTATPFANVLIPHDTVDPSVGNDLYPKDFIVDLPKPKDYFGAEEIFGLNDPASGISSLGMSVIRQVSDTDIAALEQMQLPASLDQALLDFVLGGAARAQRGDGNLPATMLIHSSQRIAAQAILRKLVADRFAELRDEWRYQRANGIESRLRNQWETEFRPLIEARRRELDVGFEKIETFIGPFFEAVSVREINSATGQVLDYDLEPTLKAIAVGGNRLSRGLTLEGLLVSYFVRRSVGYDTLMQMGRWFGFRAGYEDLTRIYTTPELAGWFGDLAYVEHRLRQDIRIYEEQGLSPLQVGVRIWQHPAMQVTSALKRRFASTTRISQSYRLSLEQTFKFPLRRAETLARQADDNLDAVRRLLARLGSPDKTYSSSAGPCWIRVPADEVLRFLGDYQVDELARSISLPLITAYIEKLNAVGELTRWTIAVRGRENPDPKLGYAEWQSPTGPIAQVSRSRVGLTDSLGVITSPGDEGMGLTAEEHERAKTLEDQGASFNVAARRVRAPEEGLLLLYPISRASGYDVEDGGSRRPLLDDPAGRDARDIVGLAISFPDSRQPDSAIEAYLEGSVKWRPAE